MKLSAHVAIPLCLGLLLSIGPGLAAEGLPGFTVAPGATTISPEEAAIATDVAQGIEGALVLVAETDRDESMTGISQIAHHVRAKILSNEARGLADITIPYDINDSKLVKWWGRTILPDGKVLELHEEELARQSVTSLLGFKTAHLKGALPGVVPGSVIDYGYVLQFNGIQSLTVNIEGRWAVRELRYAWRPYPRRGWAMVLLNNEGKSIRARSSEEGVLITAENVRPVPNEPFMPPYATTHAAAVLYYRLTEEREPRAFWDLEAKRMDRWVGEFAGKRAMKALLTAMAIPAELPLEEKLRRAYDWMAHHVKPLDLLTAEEKDAAPRDDGSERNLKRLVEKREAHTWELGLAFVAVARELGATAYVVSAADRTERFWTPTFLSAEQLDWRLVEVVVPGGKPTILAPGSGLPYGHVPWWLTGVTALAADPEGARATFVPPLDAAANVIETSARLSFGDENESVLATWNVRATGQPYYDTRRAMRGMGPEERTRRLEKSCGAASGVEVVTSSAPAFADFDQPFTLACSIERAGAGVGSSADFAFKIGGPWFEDLPELTSAKRVFPVIFPFPSTERSVVEITSPQGYAPGEASPAVEFETPFGHYTRKVTATAAGFHVERLFLLRPLIVKPADYPALLRWLEDIRRSDQAPVHFKRVPGAA